MKLPEFEGSRTKALGKLPVSDTGTTPSFAKMLSASIAGREMSGLKICDNGISIALNGLHLLFSVKKIKCTYTNGDPTVFWLIYLVNQDNQVFAKYMLPEDDAPLFVRQLLVVKNHLMLYNNHARWPYFKNCICKECYNSDLSNVQLLHADTGLDDIFYTQADKNRLFSKVITSLHSPPANASRLAFMAALHWRNFVKKNIARRRAQARTELLREDLIAAAWHPRRFGDWCLDCEERAELAELFAKK